jgi:hypothetical protein
MMICYKISTKNKRIQTRAPLRLLALSLFTSCKQPGAAPPIRTTGRGWSGENGSKLAIEDGIS